jgi:hypothetical protein
MSKTSLFNNPIYQNLLKTLDPKKIFFKGAVVDLGDFTIDDISVSINFDMIQAGIQPMIFNADFNNVQKTDGFGNLVISSECFMRMIFDQNILQDDFKDVNKFINYGYLFRGGIHTSPSDKNLNVSLTKCINTSVKSKSYVSRLNDRLGFKADDDNENYLNTDHLYENVVFSAVVKLYLYQWLKNIRGQDFAQRNALKAIEMTDEQVNQFINKNIPITDGVLNLDTLVSMITDKINHNIPKFSHRGVCAEFKIENLNISSNII